MSVWRTLGNILRKTGQAIDSAGLGVQGRTGYKETVPLHHALQSFDSKKPRLAADTFVAPNASVIGDVTLGRGSSVWYGAVLRGDVNSITVGENTNIQDGAIIHVARHNPKGQAAPTTIGNSVTIGHGAIIHAATIEDGCLVGMGATVLDGATVEKGSIVAAGAIVPPGKTVPSGQVWAGAPASRLRDLREGEADFIVTAAVSTATLAAIHAAENAKTYEEVLVDTERRIDRQERSLDYDSHMGIERDPITREITAVSRGT